MSILRISETLYSKQRVNSVNAPTILPPGAPTPLTVDYIIVAGGGAGTGPTRGAENASDGGGAGGVLVGNVNLNTGIQYTITVGAGGAGGIYAFGNPGGNSYISGSGIATFEAIGGGSTGFKGGSTPGSNPAAPAAHNYPSPAPSFYTPAGAQGYPGGAGGQSHPNWGGGGGGGAGGVGGSIPAPNGYAGGAGGVGYTWPYNGTTYAGGGGGGSSIVYGGSGPGGSAGPGGGGAGAGPAPIGNMHGSPASVNTGGGGGGGGGQNSSGYYPNWNLNVPGAGGSGIVALVVPTPAFPGTAPGATVTTPVNAPGKTVITFTSSGTITF